MNETKTNKLETVKIKKLMWQIGLPMIVSMVLQALYNVVDSVFVTNMKDTGVLANEALTYAFPVQILIIAIGVGTGIGLNALLSKNLGEKNQEAVNKVAGNGIFLSIIIYLIFLIFGLFGSRPFISLFTKNEEVLEMGTSYLMICTTLSFGAIGFSIYERLLQATGKSMYSTIAQIVGALTNIIFDYVFIFPLKMGVKGAALATVLGQVVSLILAMIFHYLQNKEINGNIIHIKPDLKIIKAIYKIGLSATLMQGMLSLMMAGMNKILSLAGVDSSILVGAFGIYYKIQQVALFSCFGLSNTIITILSFNYGMKEKNRSMETIKYGIIDTLIVSLIITIIFELTSKYLVLLFSLGNTNTELIKVCENAIHIASLSYIFMGFNVAIQGVFQALRYALRPLFTAFLRLIFFTFIFALVFVKTGNVTTNVWWTFLISEVLTSIVSFFYLKNTIKTKISPLE